MSKKVIQIGPQPGMQTAFMQAPETEVFMGGQAGGGKSFALILDAMRYISERNYKAVIFRRTYDDLSELINYAREIYLPCGAKYSEARHEFKWPNNATIIFRHLQHIKHIYSHQGKEYDYIGFDELPQFPKLAYTYLFSRLRGTNPNIKRYIRGTGNPDGEGLLWVKNRFFDPMPPLTTGYFKTVSDKDTKVTQHTKGAVSRKFIPCIRAENKALMDNDPEYENRLDQLPEDKKRALKDGLWTIMDRPNQLIPSQYVEAALNGENKYIDDGRYTLGGDFGTYTGVDQSVLFIGKGNRPTICKSWPTTKTTHFAQYISLEADKLPIDRLRIGVDCIGPGCGVGDDLEEHHLLGNILNRCTHKDPIFDEFQRKNPTAGVIRFDDLRSQMCWQLRLDFEKGNIDLSAFQKEVNPVTGEGYFEDLNKLLEEIYAHTFRVYVGRLIVVSKEELRKPENLGRSPDFFDALVIWNWTRRDHREADHNIDYEYQVDEYMTKYMRQTGEFDDDEAVYEDSEFDVGEYYD